MVGHSSVGRGHALPLGLARVVQAAKRTRQLGAHGGPGVNAEIVEIGLRVDVDEEREHGYACQSLIRLSLDKFLGAAHLRLHQQNAAAGTVGRALGGPLGLKAVRLWGEVFERQLEDRQAHHFTGPRLRHHLGLDGDLAGDMSLGL